jgi:hypothetical protein
MPLNQSREAEKETVKDGRQLPESADITYNPFTSSVRGFLFLL